MRLWLQADGLPVQRLEELNRALDEYILRRSEVKYEIYGLLVAIPRDDLRSKSFT